MENEVKFTQERLNLILDLNDQNKRQQDEIDRLRRVTKALNEKMEQQQLYIERLQRSSIFGPIGS